MNNCILHGESLHEEQKRGKLYSRPTCSDPMRKSNKILPGSGYLISSWNFIVRVIRDNEDLDRKFDG